MLLIDNDDELPSEPQEEEARFSAEVGAESVGAIGAALTATRDLWLKAARIIHDAVTFHGYACSDGSVDFDARRLLVLVGAGLLEGRDNPCKPRYIEVRLPAPALEDER
jgi:hypothetical protein